MRVPVSFLLIALVLAGGASGCDKDKKDASSNESQPKAAVTEEAATKVKVATAVEGVLGENVDVTGHLEAYDSATVHSRIAGKVIKVLYKVGDKVKEGQPLILLDDSALRASEKQAEANVLAAEARLQQAKDSMGLTDTQLDLEVNRAQQAVYQAQAQVSLTKANLDDAIHNQKRQRSLYEQSAVSKYSVEQNDLRAQTCLDQWEAAKSSEKAAQEALKIAKANRRQVKISESEVKAASAAVEQAKAALLAVRTDLRDTVIKSPITGTVVARSVNTGQAFGGGSSNLMEIEDTSRLQMYAPLDEKYRVFVKPGTELKVHTSLNVSANGKIIDIVPRSDINTHMMKVRIKVENTDKLLFEGNYATATIKLRDYKGILIPRSCINNNENQLFVVAMEDGIAKRIPVKVIFQNDTKAIVSGVESGKVLVTSGGLNIFDGQKLEIASEGTDK